jgi:hypothetical protein
MTERPMAFTRAGFAGRYQDFANATPYGAKPYGAKPYDAASRRAALDRLDVLANVLDTAFILPGTGVRFGVESLLRLVPGVGDLAASALSAYLLYEASRLGVPRLLMIRMAANVLLEGTLGAVPLAGDAFDVFFRANRRNVALLRRHFARQGML